MFLQLLRWLLFCHRFLLLWIDQSLSGSLSGFHKNDRTFLHTLLFQLLHSKEPNWRNSRYELWSSYLRLKFPLIFDFQTKLNGSFYYLFLQDSLCFQFNGVYWEPCLRSNDPNNDLKIQNKIYQLRNELLDENLLPI